MARNRQQRRRQQEEEGMSVGRRKTRRYLLIILGFAIVAGVAWFSFFLPEVSAGSPMEVQCQALCNDVKNSAGVIQKSMAVEYCKRSFDLGSSELVEGERQSYCRDGAHCFNRYECEYENEDITAERCIEILHDYYTNYNGESSERAAEHIVEIYDPSTEETGVGTCNLDAEWYDKMSSVSQVQEVVR